MARRVIRVVAAVIEHNGRYLLTQRNSQAVLPLLWEFPGGRVEDSETDEQALAREVVHRLGVTIDVKTKLGDHHHEYDDYDVHLAMYECELNSDVAPEPITVNAMRWVASAEFDNYQFPAADEKSMSKLLGLTRDPT